MEQEAIAINKKTDAIKSLIEKYKEHISTTRLQDEVYKWQLINEYKGRPNTDAEDFYEEIKSIKFQNLVYAMGIAVIQHIANKKPEELRSLFKYLFDHTKDLTERINAFDKGTLKLYREMGETLQHHQDERSIATYLTYYDPSHYTFYKYGIYNEYCKFLQIKKAKKNERYVHYLGLIDELIENYIKPDEDLINQVKGFIPDHYDGTEHKILAQDILYQMLDKGKEINYWVFQGNPKVYDFETAFRKGAIKDWTVTDHKDKIKKGDKVIIWITGKNPGCYALAEVTSEPTQKKDQTEDEFWKAEEPGELKVEIKVTHNLIENPIFQDQISSDEKLKDIKVGHQGTNFSATEDHYNSILNLIKNPVERRDIIKSTYPLNTILYGPPGTGKTYNTILRAAEIIEGRKIESYSEAMMIFKKNLHDRIEFITFHQNYSYEDFIQGLRPDTENDQQLTFERKDGIFKIIADKALKNLKESEQPVTVKKPFEKTFNEFVEPLTEGEVEEIEVQMKKVSFFITAITNKSIDFRKSGGGTDHSLSIATLKKMYEAESVLEIQGLSSYYSPLLDKLLTIGKDSEGKKEKVERKNYVLIIDEINRANISRVFGELITLIEPDKRSHGAIPIEVKLPSGEKFLVPSNLYIIGTMNTADKSIALLDIALRRRFEFEAMYPIYDIPDHEIYDRDILLKINDEIKSSKGHDFQIGHAYFMDGNNDLKMRMNKKVIPLLLEYYMNDENEVKSILSKAGLELEEKSWPIKITGKRRE